MTNRSGQMTSLPLGRSSTVVRVGAAWPLVAIIISFTVIDAGCTQSAGQPRGVESPPFERLATMISNPYGRKGIRLDEPRRNFDEIARTLQELKSCSDPVVVASAKEMELGRNAVAHIEASQNKSVDRANQVLVKTGTAALRGDFIETETRDIVNADGRVVGHEQVDADHGNDAVAASVVFVGLSVLYGASKADAEALEKSESHRMAAWKELEPHLPKYYPNARLGTNLVRVSVVPPEPARPKPGRFTAKNVSGQRLSNVQLRIDLAHYETYPEPDVRQLYYVPVWEPGESLQFATKLDPNLATGSNPKPVPLEALAVGVAQPNPDAWIRGVGGVIEARIEVWSDQTHQPEQTIHFDTNVSAASTWELKHAWDKVRSWMRSESMRSQRTTTKPASVQQHKSFIPERVDDATNAQATRGTAQGKTASSALIRTQSFDEVLPQVMERMDRIIKFTPIDSQAYRLAQEFKKDPQASVIDSSRRRLSELNQSIESGTFIKSLVDSHSTPTRCAVLMRVAPSDPDGRSATATIWMADDPSDSCKFTGDVEYDPKSMGPVMWLRLAPARSQKVDSDAKRSSPAPISGVRRHDSHRFVIGYRAWVVGAFWS